MIVMVIMGLSLTLVGGITFKQLDSSRQLKEIEQVFSLLDQARFNALNNQTAFEIELNGNVLTIKPQPAYWLTARAEPDTSPVPRQHEFETLHFAKQEFSVNANGFWSVAQIVWAPASAPSRQREYQLPTVGIHYEF
nr:hypothetical protein [Rheinheimera sp. D18]